MKSVKIICTIFLFFYLNAETVAQLADRKGLFGFSLGPSFPVGKFASTDLTDSLAGLANSGFTYNLNFDYRLGPYIGITALLRAQNNPVDKSSISNLFIATGLSTTVDAGDWKVNSFLAGLYITTPLSSTLKSYFDGRIMVGFESVSSPTLKITVTDFYNTAWSQQESATSTAFGVLIGGGFHFNVSETIAILTNADFLLLNAAFKNVKITSSSGPTEYTNFNQSINTFNLEVGIALRLK